MRDNRAQLAELETLDMGKPLDEALWDIDDVAACFDFYAQLVVHELGADGDRGEPVDVGMAEFSSKVVRQPVGVAGLISPWNYPLLMATWKVAPALAAGALFSALLRPVLSLLFTRMSDEAEQIGVRVLAVVRDLSLAAGECNIVLVRGVLVPATPQHRLLVALVTAAVARSGALGSARTASHCSETRSSPQAAFAQLAPPLQAAPWC